MRNVQWGSAFLGAIFGAVVSTGAIVGAAPGDYVYSAPVESKEISLAQAAEFADHAIAIGCWSGTRADIKRLKLNRIERADGTKGARCTVNGIKTADPNNVPLGVRVEGRVE